MSDIELDAIALFFAVGNQTKKSFIPRSVYADPNHKLPASAVQDYWKKSTLLEEGRDKNDKTKKPYFVVNLPLLEDPGVTPEGGSDTEGAPAAPRSTLPAPQAGDLVVIPWNDEDNAFLVPKAVYQDPTKCPPLSDADNSDLIFMALSEGVVLANVPKEDPTGATCFVLNLLALKSYP